MISGIRAQILRLTADWLRDQADNGFDGGGMEAIMDAAADWGEEAHLMVLEEARRLASELDARAESDPAAPAAYSIVHPDGRPSERSFYVRQERKEAQE